jgi:low affinity Fe/Cu permease
MTLAELISFLSGIDSTSVVVVVFIISFMYHLIKRRSMFISSKSLEQYAVYYFGVLVLPIFYYLNVKLLGIEITRTKIIVYSLILTVVVIVNVSSMLSSKLRYNSQWRLKSLWDFRRKIDDEIKALERTRISVVELKQESINEERIHKYKTIWASIIEHTDLHDEFREKSGLFSAKVIPKTVRLNDSDEDSIKYTQKKDTQKESIIEDEFKEIERGFLSKIDDSVEDFSFYRKGIPFIILDIVWSTIFITLASFAPSMCVIVWMVDSNVNLWIFIVLVLWFLLASVSHILEKNNNIVEVKTKDMTIHYLLNAIESEEYVFGKAHNSSKKFITKSEIVSMRVI